MAKKTIAKKLPAYKKITEDDLKILYQIKEQMIKDREENISPQQKMLIQVSDFIIDSNKDKLTATMISKALREIGVSIGTKSIKSFLLSRGYEPYRNVKNQAQNMGQISAQNQAQKIAKNEAMNELENEAIKEDEKETQKVEENITSNTPQNIDEKEIKKDEKVMTDEELQRIEKEVEKIKDDETHSLAKKHEKIETLKDSSIAALKNRTKYPNGMSKEEYEKSVTIDPEIAAEGRAKKKIIGG